jgi:hypothetical protein
VPVAGAPFVGIEAVLDGIVLMCHHDQGALPEFGLPLETPTRITRTWVYSFAERPHEHGVDIFTFSDGLIIHKDAFRRIYTVNAPCPL